MEWYEKLVSFCIKPMTDADTLNLIVELFQQKLDEGYELIGDIRVEFLVSETQDGFCSSWTAIMDIEPRSPFAPIQILDVSMLHLIDRGVIRYLPNAGVVR